MPRERRGGAVINPSVGRSTAPAPGSSIGTWRSSREIQAVTGVMTLGKTLYVTRRNQWRAWLAKHHASAKERRHGARRCRCCMIQSPIKEKPFIAKVLSDLNHRHTLFNLKRVDIENALIRREVELRDFRRSLTGDINILVRPQHKAQTAARILAFAASADRPPACVACGLRR